MPRGGLFSKVPAKDEKRWSWMCPRGRNGGASLKGMRRALALSRTSRRAFTDAGVWWRAFFDRAGDGSIYAINTHAIHNRWRATRQAAASSQVPTTGGDACAPNPGREISSSTALQLLMSTSTKREELTDAR